jgi:hypothetical protein
MSDPRFTLEWDRPFMEGAATHVSLFDGGTGPLYIVASGHGSDDASALRDLWEALVDRRESPHKIAFVAEEYRALTGKTLPPQSS